jgi:hypothetical protein
MAFSGYGKLTIYCYNEKMVENMLKRFVQKYPTLHLRIEKVVDSLNTSYRPTIKHKPRSLVERYAIVMYPHSTDVECEEEIYRLLIDVESFDLTMRGCIRYYVHHIPKSTIESKSQISIFADSLNRYTADVQIKTFGKYVLKCEQKFI